VKVVVVTVVQRTAAAAETADRVWTSCARFSFRRYGNDGILAPAHA
jgi:hypothetical protein